MGQITARVVFETLLLTLFPFILCLLSPVLAAHYVGYGIYESINVLPYTLLMMVCFYAVQQGQVMTFIWSATLAVGYSYIQIADLPTPLDNKASLLSLILPTAVFGFFTFSNVTNRFLQSVTAVLAVTLPFLLFIGLAGAGHFSSTLLPVWKVSGGFAIMRLPAASLVIFLFACYRLPLISRQYDRTVLYAYSLLGLVPILYILARHADPFLNLEVLRMETAFCFSGASLLILYASHLMQRHAAFVDRLTGLPNLRALHHVMSHLARKYAIATADVDLFDRVARIYGEDEARNLVRFVAKHLAGVSGKQVFRLDGHRFSIISSGKDDFELAHTMDQVCENLSKQNFYIRRPPRLRALTTEKDRQSAKDPLSKERLQVSLSVGVAGKHARQKPWDVLLTAHRALKKAKAHGGNTIVLQGAGPQLEIA